MRKTIAPCKKNSSTNARRTATPREKSNNNEKRIEHQHEKNNSTMQEK
jgi:hypothetical protein